MQNYSLDIYHFVLGVVLSVGSTINMDSGKLVCAVSIVIAAGLIFNIVHKRQKGTTKVNEVSS